MPADSGLGHLRLIISLKKMSTISEGERRGDELGSEGGDNSEVEGAKGGHTGASTLGQDTVSRPPYSTRGSDSRKPFVQELRARLDALDGEDNPGRARHLAEKAQEALESLREQHMAYLTKMDMDPGASPHKEWILAFERQAQRRMSGRIELLDNRERLRSISVGDSLAQTPLSHSPGERRARSTLVTRFSRLQQSTPSTVPRYTVSQPLLSRSEQIGLVSHPAATTHSTGIFMLPQSSTPNPAVSDISG